MKVVDSKNPFSYASGKTPSTYCCGDCNVTGVKLWRDYNTFLNHQTLRCCDCAGKKENKFGFVEDIDPNGKIDWEFRGQFMGRTDQIGSLIPAVPTEQNDTFWGYTSVPEDGCVWWRNLPNRKP
jgi:hypothetical protein